MINQFEGFHNEIIQMLPWGTLRIEGAISRQVSMVDIPSKNKNVCEVQFIVKWFPKQL